MEIIRKVDIVCLLCFNLFSQDKKPEEGGLKVLILGGTTFLGPHLTNELLSHGHQVTHFNRGNEHGFSFPRVEILQGDRGGNLKAIKGRKWDAVIDTCGYFPRIVEASSKVLAGATNHYTFISTIRVYDNFNQPNIDEDFPLEKLDNNIGDEFKITDKTYGPLKAGCEKVIKSYFPDRSLIIRPGIIVGPYDPTDRFTYWVRRIADGGKVFCLKQGKPKPGSKPGSGLQVATRHLIQASLQTAVKTGVRLASCNSAPYSRLTSINLQVASLPNPNS